MLKSKKNYCRITRVGILNIEIVLVSTTVLQYS